jgi:hypothetical protein
MLNVKKIIFLPAFLLFCTWFDAMAMAAPVLDFENPGIEYFSVFSHEEATAIYSFLLGHETAIPGCQSDGKLHDLNLKLLTREQIQTLKPVVLLKLLEMSPEAERIIIPTFGVVSDDILAEIAKKEHLQELEIADCNLLTTLEPLAGHQMLVHVGLFGNNKQLDLTVLNSCPRFLSLALSHDARSNLEGISRIRNLQRLKFYEIGEMVALRLEEIFPCQQLQTLELHVMKPILNLQPLSQMPRLKKLILHHCDHIADLLSLCQCKNLRELTVNQCKNYTLFTTRKTKGTRIIVSREAPLKDLTKIEFQQLQEACPQLDIKKVENYHRTFSSQKQA